MPSDVAKACYQAAMGAEHLLADVSAARRYFDAELEATQARDGDLVEYLSDDICRVDLGVLKGRGLSSDALFEAFVATASVKRGGRERLVEYLEVAENCILESESVITIPEWREFLEKYRAAGLPAIHHSVEYRESEHPAYRIVARELLYKIEE